MIATPNSIANVPSNPNTDLERVPIAWHPPALLSALTELATTALTIVEVGSWLGHSALALAHGTPGKVYCVDHWQGAANSTGPVKDALALYEAFLDNIQADESHHKIVPLFGDSAAISKLFARRPIDMLYIDGAHDHASVMRDLLHWVPFVVLGGLVCGDDYSEVKTAVQEFFRTQQIASIDLLASNRLWVARVNGDWNAQAGVDHVS
jgi:predicted O-methyltransferase YrrM